MHLQIATKMNSNIVHILLIVFISGVIGFNSTKLTDDGDDAGIVINGKNATDIPPATTVPSASSSDSPPPQPPITTAAPPTPTTHEPTTTTPQPQPPTTLPPTPKPNTTTTTTEKPIPTVTPSPPTIAPPTPTTPTNNVTSTNAPTPPPPAHKGRHFDGPSFIGGIILASGLMAISFVSWKFYKARTERNYHTL